MNTQDWIAAAIALSAFAWLMWRFRSMMGGSGKSCGSGCAKCGTEGHDATSR